MESEIIEIIRLPETDNFGNVLHLNSPLTIRAWVRWIIVPRWKQESQASENTNAASKDKYSQRSTCYKSNIWNEMNQKYNGLSATYELYELGTVYFDSPSSISWATPDFDVSAGPPLCLECILLCSAGKWSSSITFEEDSDGKESAYRVHKNKRLKQAYGTVIVPDSKEGNPRRRRHIGMFFGENALKCRTGSEDEEFELV
ncbi:hypothetical protein F5884DRAFT_869910 [Xylogone sp. PMI_703]|nr:hypothetical protein F5884DRAFT_869910 [Xylogone sp. PMI_703]